MLSTSKVLFILLLLNSLMGRASNKVGNGGNVVLCKENGTSKSVLLDFYEAGLSPQLSQKSALLIAEDAFKKLKLSAPKLADQYLKRLGEIGSKIEYRANIKISEISDSKHYFEPLSKNCQVIQTAVRKKTALKSESQFLIRKDIWETLQPADQAGLLTHEIIYEHLSKLGEENSIKARKLNAYLYNDDPKKENIWKLIAELDLPIYP